MKQLLFDSVHPSTGKSRSEHFILVIVAILGLLGSSYMLKNCVTIQADTLNPGNQSIVSSSQSPASFYGDHQVLSVEGDMQADKPLKFSFNTLTSESSFMIDFGNGEKRRCTSEALTYAYAKPGNYKVQLHTIDGKRVRMIESRTVLISPQSMYH
jgi:hypothetical protein